ncbi:hypothetical protein C7N43_31665 [Sphingobacteriales bacterium UPWRP_1]|nr:hypothetical protein C7N43_31665 [Sphingobacteriales bacterium UPWRP_1]
MLLLSLLLGCSETAANKDLVIQIESKTASNVSPDALKAEPATAAAQAETKTNNNSVSTAYSPNANDASLLLNLIKEQQNLLVKKSCGELTYECFTHTDLNSEFTKIRFICF